MGSVLALLAAASFGVSDVVGAVAARRASALTVTLSIQAVGLLALAPVLLLVPGRASTAALLVGAAAGTAGAGALVLYLRGMATGPIGLVSPVSALVGAGVPVAWGVLLLGEAVTTGRLLGIVLGLAAVVAVAVVPGHGGPRAGPGPLALAVLAGIGFGAFFILLDATPSDAGLWPVLGARLAAVPVLLTLVLARGRPVRPAGAGALVVVSGIGDVAGNVLFLLATRVGLLSLVALLTSLYPVVAVLVARWWLGERLRPLQLVGVSAAVAATLLLSLGG